MVTAPLYCISLQTSDIFFCIRYDYLQYQNSTGSLFKEPMFFTQYSFLPAFLRLVQNVWKANAGFFFLVYSARMNFFHLIFPCMNFFFLLPPPPPPPHNFSNGLSLNQNLNETFIFLNKKQALLYSTSSLRTLEIAFTSLKLQTFLGEHTPRPTLKKGTNESLLILTVGDSIKTCWLF